jgi:hypothetical protein
MMSAVGAIRPEDGPAARRLGTQKDRVARAGGSRILGLLHPPAAVRSTGSPGWGDALLLGFDRASRT